MTNTNCLNEPGLITSSWVIFGKKTDISSEYEDLSTEEEEVTLMFIKPWWWHH